MYRNTGPTHLSVCFSPPQISVQLSPTHTHENTSCLSSHKNITITHGSNFTAIHFSLHYANKTMGISMQTNNQTPMPSHRRLLGSLLFANLLFQALLLRLLEPHHRDLLQTGCAGAEREFGRSQGCTRTFA